MKLDNFRPNLDLSVATLAKACKGNVKLLPSIMVHANHTWPKFQQVMLDSKNRIHMRRSTFEQAVCGTVPLRPGLWHSIDVQEFHIDLQPHHLQGSDGMADRNGYKHSRAITGADEFGRNPWEPDYGTHVPEPRRKRDRSREDRPVPQPGSGGCVKSTVFSDLGGE